MLSRLRALIADCLRTGSPKRFDERGYAPVNRTDVQVAITKLVDDLHSLEDVERVNKRIAGADAS